MNVNKSALDKAYRLAHDSGKVEPGRLVKAMSLVHETKLQFGKYMVPGTDQPWYAISVEKSTGKPVIAGCICKDHQRNRGRLCKHMLAVLLIIRAGEIEIADMLALEPASASRERLLSILYPYND